MDVPIDQWWVSEKQEPQETSNDAAMCPKDSIHFSPPALARATITFYLHPCQLPPVWSVCFCCCLLPSTFHTTARIILFIFVVIIYSLIVGKLLHNVVLVSTTQQCNSAIITCMSPPSPYPTLLGHHRSPCWAPCAIQQFLTSYPFCTW